MLSRIDRLRLVGLLFAILACMAGCAPVVHKKGESPLAKPTMSPDSVVLEIYFVRFPFDDPQINGTTWDEIDEQPFEARLRKQLAESGIRAGIIKGELPSELQKLIVGEPEPEVEPPPEDETPSEEESESDVEKPAVVKIDEEASTRKRTLQIRAGHRSEILASGVYDSLPLIELDQGQLRGKPYPKGQGLFGVKSYPQGDGRVRLELSPELHYGDPKINYVGDQGMFRLDTGRSKRVFENLALSATLAPGEMIVLGSLPQRRGSLGHYFFTEQAAGKLDQKLLIIRLAQTQYDDLFGGELIVPPEQ